jgi:hypothetical protein
LVARDADVVDAEFLRLDAFAFDDTCHDLLDPLVGSANQWVRRAKREAKKRSVELE